MSNNEETPRNRGGAAQPPTATPNEGTNNNAERSSEGNRERKQNRREKKQNRREKKQDRREKKLDRREKKQKHREKKQKHRQRAAERATRLKWYMARNEMEMRLSGIRNEICASAGRGIAELQDKNESHAADIPAMRRQWEAELQRDLRLRQLFLGQISEQRVAECYSRAQVAIDEGIARARADIEAATEARACELRDRAVRDGDAITQQGRRRLRIWREPWKAEEGNETELGMAETDVREGIKREMAEEFVQLDDRKQDVLAEINADVSRAILVIKIQVDDRYWDMWGETRQRVLDEMGRQLDPELCGVERQLAECGLKGE